MRRRFLPRPSAGLAVALVALFVALGGSAVAKLVITGSSIKRGSITGANIKRDSLTGVQIKESSLGTVPSANNANSLGGKGAVSFQPADHWALVAGSATGANILAQSGGMSVSRFAAGRYLVGEAGSTSSKPLSATLNGTIGFPQAEPCGGTANNPGGVNCPLFNDNNHILVQIINPQVTAFIDGTFYVTIGG